MIRQLKLTNFKKHADKTIDFTDGLNGIFGPNYTGKTTILYGILFALGGASHVPGTNLQKKGTNHGMSVVMEFTIGDVNYIVSRKKTGAYLYADELMIASGTSNVTEKIEELLGMSIKRFRQLKYAEQKKAHALLTVGATELHKILEELTGLDQINNVMAKLKEIVAKASGALEVLREVDLKPLREKEKELNNEYVLLSGNVDRYKVLKMAVEADMHKLSPEISAMQNLREEYDDWKTEMVGLEAGVSIHTADLEKLKLTYAPDMDLQEADRLFQESETEIGLLENEISNHKADAMQASQLKSSILRLEAFVSGTHKTIERCQSDLNDISESLCWDEVEDAKLRCEAISSDMAKKQSEYTNILKLFESSKCPTCGREYDSSVTVEESQVEELEGEVDRLVAALKKEKAVYSKLKNQMSVKTELENDIRRNVEHLTEGTLSLSELRKELAVSNLTTKTEEQIKLSVETVKTKRKSLQDMREVVSKQASVRAQMAEAQSKLSEVKSRMEILLPEEPPFDPSALKKHEADYEELVEKRDEYLQKMMDADKEAGEASVKLHSCKADIKEAERQNKEFVSAKKKYSTAKELQKYLRDNRDRYTGEVWDFFLGSASSFASSCTNGTITDIQRTESGQFQFVEDGEVMGIKDASGAQEAIMGLSVQVALAQAAHCPLDILLVDEPTADMDADHSMAVAGMLSTKGLQVIAISHREMDASLCNNVILMEN